MKPPSNIRIIKCLKYLIYLLLIIHITSQHVEAQRTRLDSLINFKIFNKALVRLIKPTGDVFDFLKKQGKLQTQISNSTKFFCDTNNSRSIETPKSVHKLRPGDIDIIGALGDSLTAGNGIMATNLLHVPLENRGMSWSIGGQGTWRQFLTIPNILKEFNPNLYGYSLMDATSTDRSTKFNVAHLAAMSRDTPYMAKVLIERMKNDPKVNMTHHWKLITYFIGNNDFCSDMCYYDNPEVVIDMHEQDLVQTLRILRDNIPKLMVNVLPPPNLRLLTELDGKPNECYVTHRFECPCLVGIRVQPHLHYFTKIMEKWIAREKEVIDRDEFNRDDFTVNYQPFTTNVIFPRLTEKYHDFSLLSTDCFHLSQKGQARAANAMWNNMLEPVGKKSTNWHNIFEIFKCPSEEQPFLMTRENSIKNQNEIK